MRSLCIDLTALSDADLPLVGGKARALGRLADTGLPVPPGICLTTFAYAQYLDATGLRQRLPLLLERKPFQEMRWEELWDLGLRIRSLFLNTPLPKELAAEIIAALPPPLDPHPSHSSLFRPGGGFGGCILCRPPRLFCQCPRPARSP